MAAAQALFTLLFTHGFATLNAQAVETAWPGIESALRTQTAEHRPSNARGAAPGIRAHPPRPPVRDREGHSGDLRALSHRRGHARTGRLLRHRDRREDAAGDAKVLPEAFASVLPRMQSMMAETQDSFLKLLRERGLLK